MIWYLIIVFVCAYFAGIFTGIDMVRRNVDRYIGGK